VDVLETVKLVPLCAITISPLMIRFLKDKIDDEDAPPDVTGTFGNFKEVFVDIYYKYKSIYILYFFVFYIFINMEKHSKIKEDLSYNLYAQTNNSLTNNFPVPITNGSNSAASYTQPSTIYNDTNSTKSNNTIYYNDELSNKFLNEPGVDSDELRMGIQQEFETTRDVYLAKKIAMDNIKIDPKYYSSLEKYFTDLDDTKSQRTTERGMGFTNATQDYSSLSPSEYRKKYNTLTELKYIGNMGVMEIMKFMEVSSDEQKKIFEKLCEKGEPNAVLLFVSKVIGKELYPV
jgi:hypothetical protein